MPVVMPPAGGLVWANLDFGGVFLKSYPQAATTQGKGLTTGDLDYGMQKAQNTLYALLRQFYPKATLDSWTGAVTPLQVTDWADELAAMYVLHLASTGGRVDRKDNYRESATKLVMDLKKFLKAGMAIIGADGDIVPGLDEMEMSAAGVRGPASSDSLTSEVFTERVLEILVEDHGDGTDPRTFTTEKEAFGD